jgi:NAD(P)-dependent dehydrogenase (short-subunit alcohol dehydrogenase family)
MSTPQAIIVTGSTSGFGRLTVQTLARQGHEVFAGIRASGGKNSAATAELQALAAREGLSLRVVELDVTDDASVEAAVRDVVATAGRLDVVVNNAGTYYRGPLEAFTVTQAQQQFETNVFGVLRVNRAALPQMRAQGHGLLLQVGSVLGRLAFPFVGLYAATKFALEGLTEAYRLELAGLGIDAAIVEPGTYPTSLGANRTEPADPGRLAPYSAGLGRMAGLLAASANGAAGGPAPDAQEVADAIARLIATPAGQRPLRTVVAIPGQREAPTLINDAADRAIQAATAALGLAGGVGR